MGLSVLYCELSSGRSTCSFPWSTTHNYQCCGMQKYHLRTLAHILAALARASPDPGSRQPPARISTRPFVPGSALVAIVISIVWHERTKRRRPSSAALGRRGGCVASGPGLPLQRHVPFAPRHLEGAGARDAASRGSTTAMVTELRFLPTIPQK